MKTTLHPAVKLAVMGSLLFTGELEILAQDAPAGKAMVSGEALSKVTSETSGSASPAVTGVKTVTSPASPAFQGKTILDDPEANDPRLSVPVNALGKVVASRLTKIDLDSDLDYDGTINNEEASDQLSVEHVPPGLELGVGELTRMVLRLKVYDEAFAGDLDVSLEVTGINRDSASGSFPAGGSGQVGRIKVWLDQARTELLLDSGDSSKLVKTWTYEKGKRSGGIPKTVYVEGVEAAPKANGDLRLMVISSTRSEGSVGGGKSSLYRPAFDTISSSPSSRIPLRRISSTTTWKGFGRRSTHRRRPSPSPTKDRA
jgi:hypothetical protein